MNEEKKSHSLSGVVALGIVVLLFGVIFIQYSLQVDDSTRDTNFLYEQIMNNSAGQYIEQVIMPTFLAITSTDRGQVNYSALYDNVDYDSVAQEAQLLNISPKSGKSTTSIVVLNYHGTIDNNDTEDIYSITTDNFKNHMFALKEAGYETVKLDDFYAFMRGEKQLPEKSFMLTFDDGIRSTYYNSDPILKALNYSAVMFAIAGYSLEKNNRYYLNKDELMAMEATGRWEVESHSYLGHGRHPINAEGAVGPFYSNKLWIAEESRLETDEEYYNRTKTDLELARSSLEGNLSKEITAFALPFGDFGQRESNYPGADRILINETEQVYRMVFYQFKPAINKDFRANYNDQRSDFYLIMRISADSIGSPERLLSEVNAAQSLSLPYDERYDNQQRWISVWGRIDPTEGEVEVEDPVSAQGAMAYLDGSYMWRDYNFSAYISQNNAKKLFLLARFKNSENYAGCKFEGRSIAVIAVNNATRGNINQMRFFNATDLGKKLTVSVNGDLVSCYVDDQKVVEAHIASMHPHGGVGIRAEDFDNKESSIAFNVLSVT